MEWLNSNVGAFQSPLEQAPEILKAVGAYAATDVPLCMIDKLVDKAPVQLVVSHGVVCVDRGAIADVLQDFILQSLAFDVGHYGRTNLAQIAVKDALHDGLAVVSAQLFVAQTASAV